MEFLKPLMDDPSKLIVGFRLGCLELQLKKA